MLSCIYKELNLDGHGRTSSPHFSAVYYFCWPSEGIPSTSFTARGLLQTLPPHCLEDSSLVENYFQVLA